MLLVVCQLLRDVICYEESQMSLVRFDPSFCCSWTVIVSRIVGSVILSLSVLLLLLLLLFIYFYFIIIIIITIIIVSSSSSSTIITIIIIACSFKGAQKGGR